MVVGWLLGPLTPNPTPLPPDDCQELLNGWHNFSFELMLVKRSEELMVVVGYGVVVGPYTPNHPFPHYHQQWTGFNR